MRSPELLMPAEIEWRDTQCYAPRFGDIYASADAQAEVERVFVEPCGVSQLSTRYGRITIAELGFGTGLNFVVTAARVLRDTTAHMHFISIEGHPLAQSDWERMRAQYHSRLPLYDRLADHAPPLLRGWHRREFCGGRIVLSVFHGDVLDGLAELAAGQSAGVDAWYLDGFAPARNPDMWSAEVFAAAARTAHEGTTVGTFTSAGSVRRALSAVGFEMQRVDQRPHKRESLAGVFKKARPRRASVAPVAVTVLGAGIGGALVARDLAQQGAAVTVVDPDGPAAGASRIPAAIMHARLLADGSATAEYRVAAYHHAGARLAAMNGVTPQPVVQICGPNLSENKLRRIAARYIPEEPPEGYWLALLEGGAVATHTGLTDAGPGLLFPCANLIDLPTLVTALLDHTGIEVRRDLPGAHPEHPMVVCNGLGALETLPDLGLELAHVHGQLDRVSMPQTTAASALVGNGYFVPGERSCIVGATYEYAPWDPGRATAANIEKNIQLLDSGVRPLSRYRATRAVTSDRLPIIGQVSDNLWMATGFGSMGTTAAPLAAAEVCSALMGWLPPLSARVRQALDPHRFRARQQRRGPAKGPGYGGHDRRAEP
ncbi:MAG: tRNA (5-methylaminomethyl-2-thiouridine)(34)-methyltransferase MnmD [Pseudomonadota bacterium]